MRAPPKSDVPIITPNELTEDAIGGLWKTQQLAGKPAGIFYSISSQGDGQETTTEEPLVDHILSTFIGLYTFGAGMFEMEEVKGGSPYGSGTYVGDGTR
ncbi:benzoquinone reductase [Medicago truncatula]|uniref:Benzoquinone reductase n=1 Tax=Medicago truncatula TaxID=3880 RepID=A0A072TS36_MEDTR|nr:benzoquinone reductase [Medicago truncatula]KEH19669.1 benzoquinone reductase [Medicago truncatula]